MVYKVIGYVVFTAIDHLICFDSLGLLQDKLSKHDNKFEKTRFTNFSGLGIPDILMNIISCHGFSKSSIITVIFTCRSSLVPYYLSKVFSVVETK